MGTFVTSDPALDDDARRRAKFDQAEAEKQPEAEKPEGDEQPERKPRRNSR